MSRYIFTKLLSGDQPIVGASCTVIDAAIEEGKRLQKKEGGTVYIIDTIAMSMKARGVCSSSGFRWIVSCGRCNGTGVGSVKSKTPPFLPMQCPCSRCNGQKVIEEVPS